MKAVTLLICASMLGGSAGLLRAETRQERGKRVVQEALEALGGQKFLDMKDRSEAGRAYSFYRDRLTGLDIAKIQTRYLETTPDNGVAMRERQTFGKNQDYYVLFTDNEGYMVTFRGARPLQAERYSRWVQSTRRNIFYVLRNRLKEPGMIFESQGATVWQNAPVEIVDIIDADNTVITVYFHQTTKLPLRQSSVRRDPVTKAKTEDVAMFAKYRDVGNGVQWPFNILAQRNGEKVFEIFSDTVTINDNLTDELFTLPESTKRLPPEK